MKAIVGLGNPGQKYAKTRHNLGSMVVDELVRRFDSGSQRERFRARLWEARLGEERIILAQPQTFMNLSGVSVQQIQRWYKIPNEDLLVVYDDVDLDFGVLRLRERGSAGGHNGMTSIVEAIGSTDIPRLRVGIGRGGPATTAHVLSGFSPAEATMLSDIIQKAADGAEIWLREGPIPAMNMLNPRNEKPKPPRIPETGAENSDIPANRISNKSETAE